MRNREAIEAEKKQIMSWMWLLFFYGTRHERGWEGVQDAREGEDENQ